MARFSVAACMKTLAIAVGVFVSLFLAPFSALFLWTGVPMFKQSPIPAIWGLAGLLGVAGFWTWACVRKPLSLPTRLLVTLCLICGTAAVSPMLALAGDRALTGAVVVLTAVGVLVSVWLPNNALETDREA